VLATPRIEKPCEESLTRHLTRQGADALLVRNAGGVEWCRTEGVPFVADYSLNASNELTTAWLLEQGAQRVTASYDLSIAELGELQHAVPAGSLEIVIHQHMPMFHMEHCVFCAFLSPGTDKTNCGRPCDQHDVKLRDRVGMEHPLTADIGCRNTLFHAVPQSAAESIPAIVGRGTRSLRIEFVNESATEVTRVLELYQSVLRAKEHPKTLWKALKAENRYGVTRGQLVVL
jgi:putative protease